MILWWCCAVFSSRNDNLFRIKRIYGAVLVCTGLLFLSYSYRVAKSQIGYHRLKFREHALPLADTVQEAQHVHSLYAHNYHLSRWISERAWYEYTNRDIALVWLEKGLTQNPHHLEMRWLETVLVGMDKPVDAARMWEAFSDRVFWNRWVMGGRIFWYSHAGRLEEAAAYLTLLDKTPGDHGWAVDAVHAARQVQGQ
jgi:hypothetical protein